MPRLEPRLTIQAYLAEPIDVGATPTGARRIFDIQGGSFEGPRLRGRVRPGSLREPRTSPPGHAWWARQGQGERSRVGSQPPSDMVTGQVLVVDGGLGIAG
jgi:hypothetical protein